MSDYVSTRNRTKEDYEKIINEQGKALTILANRCRDKQNEIIRLNIIIQNLRGELRRKK